MGTMDVRRVEPNKKVTMLTKNLSKGMHVAWWLLLDNGKKIKNIYLQYMI
jgi:hypothetical protein